MESQSLYDVVKNNFKKLGRKTYVHCYYYLGKHNFQNEEFGKFMKTVIEKGWKEYQDEPLTGFLIYYSKVYIHILEGSDYALFRHMVLLSQTKEYQENMSSLRFLNNYYHIKNRLFKGWDSLLCVPPSVSEKINIEIEEEDLLHMAFNCIKKINKLTKFISSGGNREPFKSIQRRTGDDVSEDATIMYTEMLPEEEVIGFLTECDYLNDANEILAQETRVWTTQDEVEVVWPYPDDNIPYHILTKSKPAPYPPEDKKKKEKEEEKEEVEDENIDDYLIEVPEEEMRSAEKETSDIRRASHLVEIQSDGRKTEKEKHEKSDVFSKIDVSRLSKFEPFKTDTIKVSQITTSQKKGKSKGKTLKADIEKYTSAASKMENIETLRKHIKRLSISESPRDSRVSEDINQVDAAQLTQEPTRILQSENENGKTTQIQEGTEEVESREPSPSSPAPEAPAP